MSLIRAVQRQETNEAREAGKDVIWLPPLVSSCQNKTQGLYMFEGKLLIAIATAEGVYNSQLLRCTAVAGGVCEFRDAETEAPMPAPSLTQVSKDVGSTPWAFTRSQLNLRKSTSLWHSLVLNRPKGFG